MPVSSTMIVMRKTKRLVAGLTVIAMVLGGRALLAAPSSITGQARALEVAFTNGKDSGAEALTIRAIESATSSVRMAAYSFTSRSIADALMRAHRRGVDVQVVVDKSQSTEKYTSATFLANSGVPVRIDHEHAIMHNKYLVINGVTVLTGSMNLTKAGTSSNAENIMVAWDAPDIAKAYTLDWNAHWGHAIPYQARY